MTSFSIFFHCNSIFPILIIDSHFMIKFVASYLVFDLYHDALEIFLHLLGITMAFPNVYSDHLIKIVLVGKLHY